MIADSDGRFGIIFDIDHFAVHDGPGIRTCVYLKGCPLSCRWCHSPESQSFAPETLFAPSRCANCLMCVEACPNSLHEVRDGKHVFINRDQCVRCGKCVRACPTNALFTCGIKMSAKEVAAEATEDKVFFRNSGGGVTLTGGEILFQAAFALNVLMEIKKESVHTIVETSGVGATEQLLALVPYTDVFYFDFKLGNHEKFREFVGGNFELIAKNLEVLSRKAREIVLRVPLIPTITDTPDNVCMAFETARKHGIHKVHLLPYNASAGAKYEWCAREYSLSHLNTSGQSVEALLSYAGPDLDVSLIK